MDALVVLINVSAGLPEPLPAVLLMPFTTGLVQLKEVLGVALVGR